MNVIDHRILIPRPPDRVWQYISDIGNNPTWQVNCKQIAFLTSRRSGVGMRWRMTTSSGRELVMEATAWYEGLGYEYTCVDGLALSYNRGRIRLQEIAEGTVVQWTYSFETKGFLTAVRSSLGIKRRTEAEMVDSLRKLWRVLNQTATSEAPREAKSLMREAPDYEARARYKPRHPSAKDVDESGGMRASEPQPVKIVEPPLAEEDTRPSAPASAPSEPELQYRSPVSAVADGPVSEQTAAADSPSAAAANDLRPETAPDSKVVYDEGDIEILPAKEPQPEAAPASPTGSLISAEPVAPVTLDSVEASANTEVSEQAPAAVPDQPSETALAEMQTAAVEDAAVSKDASAADNFTQRKDLDTREVSVFEVFGVPRPSQTQQLAAVTLPESTFPPAMSVSEAAPAPLATTDAAPAVGRVGLRLARRRQAARLRRPGSSFGPVKH